MQPSKRYVVKPLHEKLHACPYCYARLTFIQRLEKRQDRKVICRKCGMVIKRDRNIVYWK